MNVAVKVGKFEVVDSGDIEVFEKNDVVLNISDDNSLKMKFVFVDNNDVEKTYFDRKVEDNLLTWKIINMNRNFSILGMEIPECIGEYDGGREMYFSFSVRAVHVEKGIYNLKYAFWVER